ncbi:hypothetical protein HDU98_006697 [Podochytrium sp. JEL0797]|nr:hypothetical protein HDU98_006697 [Podochytrium sp. JEL0797]
MVKLLDQNKKTHRLGRSLRNLSTQEVPTVPGVSYVVVWRVLEYGKLSTLAVPLDSGNKVDPNRVAVEEESGVSVDNVAPVSPPIPAVAEVIATDVEAGSELVVKRVGVKVPNDDVIPGVAERMVTGVLVASEVPAVVVGPEEGTGTPTLGEAVLIEPNGADKDAMEEKDATGDEAPLSVDDDVKEGTKVDGIADEMAGTLEVVWDGKLEADTVVEITKSELVERVCEVGVDTTELDEITDETAVILEEVLDGKLEADGEVESTVDGIADETAVIPEVTWRVKLEADAAVERPASELVEKTCEVGVDSTAVERPAFELVERTCEAGVGMTGMDGIADETLKEA